MTKYESVNMLSEPWVPSMSASGIHVLQTLYSRGDLLQYGFNLAPGTIPLTFIVLADISRDVDLDLHFRIDHFFGLVGKISVVAE